MEEKETGNNKEYRADVYNDKQQGGARCAK